MISTSTKSPSQKLSIRAEIFQAIDSICPLDDQERVHLSFAKDWVASGAEIFRRAKPATPDPHLVAYFLLMDSFLNQILLVDHKKAGLWLPSGGHVEPNEHPKETVRREIIEELGVDADFVSENPFFLTVDKTEGETAGHTDVSLWYLLKGSSSTSYLYDRREFHQISWFFSHEIPYSQAHPHLKRCLAKLNTSESLVVP